MKDRFPKRALITERVPDGAPRFVERICAKRLAGKLRQETARPFSSGYQDEAIHFNSFSGNDLSCQSEHLRAIEALELTNGYYELFVG
jgi:hypothetical protein